MREINELIIHATATPDGWLAPHSVGAKVREIARWHEEKGWLDIGYHWIIDRDGSLGRGRSYAKAGAHTRGRNKNSIGIALVGGKDSRRTDKFGSSFTEAQRKTLLRLIDEAQNDFGNIKISGHNEYSSKACPGFNVQEFIGERKTKPKPAPLALTGAGVAGLGAIGAAAPQWLPVAALVAVAVIAIIIIRKVRK